MLQDLAFAKSRLIRFGYDTNVCLHSFNLYTSPIFNIDCLQGIEP